MDLLTLFSYTKDVSESNLTVEIVFGWATSGMCHSLKEVEVKIESFIDAFIDLLNSSKLIANFQK